MTLPLPLLLPRLLLLLLRLVLMRIMVVLYFVLQLLLQLRQWRCVAQQSTVVTHVGEPEGGLIHLQDSFDS
jgi:hypothetical protein